MFICPFVLDRGAGYRLSGFTRVGHTPCLLPMTFGLIVRRVSGPAPPRMSRVLGACRRCCDFTGQDAALVMQQGGFSGDAWRDGAVDERESHVTDGLVLACRLTYAYR